MLQISQLSFFESSTVIKYNQTGAINDPLCQTHSIAIVFTWNLFYSLDFEKCTNNMCEINDHYWPWLWVGRVDQELKKYSKSAHLDCATTFQLFPFSHGILTTHHSYLLFFLSRPLPNFSHSLHILWKDVCERIFTWWILLFIFFVKCQTYFALDPVSSNFHIKKAMKQNIFFACHPQSNNEII